MIPINCEGGKIPNQKPHPGRISRRKHRPGTTPFSRDQHRAQKNALRKARRQAREQQT